MHKQLVELLLKDVEEAARGMLGWVLVREINGQRVSGMIVETEAYHQRDAASHSYKGKTARTSPMFGEPGRAYVYFTYGMHFCMNVVAGEEKEGSAVLIRALQPVENIEVMRVNRPAGITDINLTNGPAKLCQALEIDKQLNNHTLTKAPLYLEPSKEPVSSNDIVSSTRIGISKDTHRLWRFYIRDNGYVSRSSG